jgi:hypothetical protein
MTEQEQQLISGLAERIRNAPQQQIDRDADNLIRRTIGGRPDALYILTQTVLIQEVALKQANAQLEQLSRAPEQPANFLPAQQQQPYYRDSGYAAPPPPPQSGGFFGGGGGGGFGSFLRNAATTAAGVVAGEVAFDTIASMFGHHGGGGFFGGGGMGISPGSETIVNNYYGDDQGVRGDGDDTRFADAASQDQNISSDIEDDRDNSGDGFVDDGSSSDSGDDGGSSDV